MGQWYQPLPDARGFRQAGIASWYGQDFHGKKTSNGEVYDMYAESAAHKTLPLGTIVTVKNLENGREMRIRINDRGPFVSGRIIDLSYASAQKLGVVQRGTARVEIEAVGTTAPAIPDLSPDYYYSGNFTIQIGAFANRDNAEKSETESDPDISARRNHCPYRFRPNPLSGPGSPVYVSGTGGRSRIPAPAGRIFRSLRRGRVVKQETKSAEKSCIY